MKHITKYNFILKTQDTSQKQNETIMKLYNIQLDFNLKSSSDRMKQWHAKVYIYIYMCVCVCIYIYKGPMTSSTREKAFHYLVTQRLDNKMWYRKLDKKWQLLADIEPEFSSSLLNLIKRAVSWDAHVWDSHLNLKRQPNFSSLVCISNMASSTNGQLRKSRKISNCKHVKV